MCATPTAYHQQHPQEALNCCVQIAHRQLSNYGYDPRLLPPDDYASEAICRILDEDKIKSPPLNAAVFFALARRIISNLIRSDLRKRPISPLTRDIPSDARTASAELRDYADVLPDSQRDVYLFVISGYHPPGTTTWKLIASEFGIQSINTVKSTWHRALSTIRDKFSAS